MKKSSVVIGLSGGVDSSVAALMLKEQGYKVIGISLKLHPVKNSTEHHKLLKQIAADIDIPFHVIDISKEFMQKVVGFYVNEHLGGHTHSPCTYCNPTIKWPHNLQRVNLRINKYTVYT